MPSIHWGSLIVGLLIGLSIYHFTRTRVSAVG